VPGSALTKGEPLSPLRYPGGKALLASYISGVIEEHFLAGCRFIEPYAGGASVSLELLRLGFISEAVLVERDPLVYAFWQCVFNDTDALCAAVEATPVTIDTWNLLQPLRDITTPRTRKYSMLQLGVAGLFFNRTNFSGIIGAGPIGGKNQSSKYAIDCRFNKPKIIKQIRTAAKFRDRISVHYGDALTYLRNQTEELATGFVFVYIDPPYYTQGKKLYRYFFEDQDHAQLAAYITAQGYPWLVSYDDHSEIRRLYEGNQFQPIYLDYKVRSSRTAQELVISNLEIPPPVYLGLLTPASAEVAPLG
jgi:DNA adenine methylase